ncbi:hypothetical protein C8J57DRAFT_749904 [Mycena rebaudengoi]|nr:hypothetical protein C8J57DRAFT_749904 [Mycena rebaudengoi]
MPTTAVHTKSTIGSLGGRKHGSFDFERPGWTAGGRGVGAASSLGVSSRTRRGASGVGTVEGRLGVGSMRQFSLATSGGGNRTVHVVPPPPPTPPQEELRQDHTGASGSSNATGGTSSWGRSTGKRLSTGLSKLTGGLLGSKASKSTVRAGKERQHGKFPFEPPVQSLPPKSTRREHSLESERERDRQWAREDREMGASSPSAPRIRHNASHSTSSTASSNNTGVSAGHRSGTKGRSLDLGLGLAWAPTKVRVDAVMPESSFGRSLSASRREQQGKEVADVFRDALDEDGYRNFKKYVHRFDAQEIPFDGPTGIVSRVERLLRKTQHLQDEERTRLLDRFVKLILQNA